MGKWFTGIIATIIAGAFIWWLTHPGGPLNPKPTPKPTKEPTVNVKLLESNLEPPNVDQTYGDRIKGTFVVYNEGDATAENCVVWLVDGGSERFGLAPGQRRTVRTLSSSLYRSHGSYDIVVWIACDNYKRTLYSQKWSF